MALPALATLATLQERLGARIENPQQAMYLLGAASTIVRSAAGKLWVNADGELEDVPDGASVVVIEMVARVSENPTGAVTNEEHLGPWGHTVSYGNNAADRLYLSAADKIILGSTASNAWTIDPTPVAAEVSDLYGAVVNAAEDSELLLS